MTNYMCQKLYPVLECLIKQQDDKPPLAANVIFAGACYTLTYPALRRIFKKRFLKRLLKLLILGLSVGSLISFLMLLTIAQTRITMCRLINSGFSRRMDLKRVLVYVVCFNLIYTYIRSRLLKSTLRRISAAIKMRMSGDQKEEMIVVKEEEPVPKITRSGTVYG